MSLCRDQQHFARHHRLWALIARHGVAEACEHRIVVKTAGGSKRGESMYREGANALCIT